MGPMHGASTNGRRASGSAVIAKTATSAVDVYFSADVETDGAIPGPFSMLSFGLVVAGRYDGSAFSRPERLDQTFEAELRPISDRFDPEALGVNGLDRERLLRDGGDPREVMTRAAEWIRAHAGGATPVLVAYPLSFDWSWLYWYFESFAEGGSPFEHSRCFDLKTAYAVKAGLPIASSGRKGLPEELRSKRRHTHRAIDDAIEQAEIFANVFEWKR
jgi:DNA polymerase III epsilon subunit-like protein